ncbi:MAG: DUF6152 family protein [Pseudomonadales bacterium]|nr:hypothetical protein [Pseudomonadales bacterium]
MLRNPILLAAVLSACLTSSTASAHHAFSAEFDAEVPVSVRGRITRVDWINPHAWIYLAVEQSDGTTIDWMFEGGTPNTLVRAGLDRHSLPVGTEILVRGYQSRDRNCVPACKANGRDLAFTDGRKVFMGSSGTGAPQDGADPNER